MAHSFDVFDAAGTHACSCQSNGSLARTILKMYCEIDIRATKSCKSLNPAFGGFNGKINQNYKNTGFSSTDVNFTMHFTTVTC
jgi:hypothetical protein